MAGVNAVTPGSSTVPSIFAHGMLPVGREEMPYQADPLLAAPEQDLFASRLWYDLTLRHALPPGGQAWLAFVGPIGTMAVPLLDVNGRLESLSTPYTVTWRPLVAAWAGPVAMEAAAAELGMLLRHRPPILLKAIEADNPVLTPLCAGLRSVGLSVKRYAHFGNWYEPLPAGCVWDDYVATREQPLRGLLQSMGAGGESGKRFDLLHAPGAALEAGIADYEALRARVRKSPEPAPGFPGALMRATAAKGLLRLGVLRARDDGRPLAAQYWLLSGGWAVMVNAVCDTAAPGALACTGLTARMVASLIGEGVSGIDLGRGDDAFKRFWARERRQRIGLLVADPLNVAGMVALARHAAGRGRRRLINLFSRRTGGERGR
jgi:hypothetical protein